jgi:hypothetical protein
MASFSLCIGSSGRSNLDAAANWQALGLEQLVFGESALPPTPLRQLLPEVRTNAFDQPCLADGLAQAAEHATHPWLLLLDGDAQLTPAMVSNLEQLCRPGQPRQLVVGRAWRLPPARLSDPLLALDDERLNQAIAADGVLDPPEQPCWLLLPRGCFSQIPQALGCRPQQVVPHLASLARQLGWPVLEATAAAPVLLPTSSEAPSAAPQPDWRSCREATGVVLPYSPGSPRFSLLLAAPEAQLPALVQRLQPAPSLPWEVIARPDLGAAAGPGSTAAAWNSALADARGDLVWPLQAELPPLALLPALLRCFETPVVDLVHLPISLGGHTLADPAADRLQPGCLAVQRLWFERLGGLDERLPAAQSLRQFLAKALQRGAHAQSLPLPALAR